MKWLIPISAPIFCVPAVSFLLSPPIFKLHNSSLSLLLTLYRSLPPCFSLHSIHSWTAWGFAVLEFALLLSQTTLLPTHWRRTQCFICFILGIYGFICMWLKNKELTSRFQDVKLNCADYHDSKVLFTKQYHMFQELWRLSRPLLWKAYSLTIAKSCPWLQQFSFLD